MTLSDAKIYVAKILGAQADTNALALAEDAIMSTYAKWQNAHNWFFLLEDNESGFSVASCTIAVDGVTVTTSVAGGFFGVNVGQTVTGTGIPASTTVSAVTAESAGAGVVSFTLSAASTPGTPLTLTFTGYIPLVSGTDMYNLPSNFAQMFSMRLLTNPRTLVYMKARERDRMVYNQTITGTPSHYTIYKKHTFNVAGQHSHVRFTPVPGASDNVLMRYYRAFNTAATSLDIPDEYLYVFLDDAQCHFLSKKNAGDPRLPLLMSRVGEALANAMSADYDETEDEDVGIKSQMESGTGRAVDFSIWDVG